MMHHRSHDLQARRLAGVYRVLKPGRRLLIADTMRPSGFFVKRLFASLFKRHGIKFGIEDLPETMKSVGVFPATRLDERFRMIGFVRAIKPIAPKE